MLASDGMRPAPRLGPVRRPLFAVGPAGVAAALAIIVATTAIRRPNSYAFALAAVVDELGHAATGVLVVAALAPRPSRFAWGLLAASLLIDADHLPRVLGSDWLTQGTPRPYPHSLLTVAVVLMAGFAIGRRRPRARLVAGGVALGLVAHFLRDLGEGGGGVPLWWPLSEVSPEMPRALYVGLMVALAVAGAVRILRDGDPLAGLRRLRRRGGEAGVPARRERVLTTADQHGEQ